MAIYTPSFVYLSGFVSWALFAWVQRLGLIPAFDAQYFLAGIIPTSIIVVIYLISIGLRTLLQKLHSREATLEATLLGRTIELTGSIVLLSAIFIFIALQSFGRILACGMLLGTALMVAAQYCYGKKGDAVMQGAAYIFSLLLLLLSGLGGMHTYFFHLFPRLSQEFGGPSPRCAQLDISTELLSPASRNLLFPADSRKLLLAKSTGTFDSGVHRTREIGIVLDLSRFIIAAVPYAANGSSGQGQPVYVRLKEDVVRNSFPCITPPPALSIFRKS